MSLLSIASPWTNDDLASKKRVPTMRKTIKKSSLPDPVQTSIRNTEETDSNKIIESFQAFEPIREQSYNDAHEVPSSIENFQNSQEERNQRVSQLLNNITAVDAENSGQHLANFKPLSHPAIQKKTDEIDLGRPGDEPMTNGYNPLQIPPPIVPQRPSGSMIATNSNDLGVSNNPYTSNTHGNYNFVYSNKPVFEEKPTSTMNTPLDNRLMEKINYMIHLLEEQKNEKTSNITEEFILYIFLGVFIIFVVDSFSKSGKYRR